MDEAVPSGARPHWEVSESLKSPWSEDACIESVRLMRVFMDAPVDELLANRGEFYSGNKTKSVSCASFLVRDHDGWPGRFRLDSGCRSPV